MLVIQLQWRQMTVIGFKSPAPRLLVVQGLIQANNKGKHKESALLTRCQRNRIIKGQSRGKYFYAITPSYDAPDLIWSRSVRFICCLYEQMLLNTLHIELFLWRDFLYFLSYVDIEMVKNITRPFSNMTWLRSGLGLVNTSITLYGMWSFKRSLTSRRFNWV